VHVSTVLDATIIAMNILWQNLNCKDSLLSFCFVGIHHFLTKNRLSYMKKYSPEKLTGRNIWTPLLGMIFGVFCLLLILNNGA